MNPNPAVPLYEPMPALYNMYFAATELPEIDVLTLSVIVFMLLLVSLKAVKFELDIVTACDVVDNALDIDKSILEGKSLVTAIMPDLAGKLTL